MEFENLENSLTVNQTETVSLSSFVDVNDPPFNLTLADFSKNKETLNHEVILPEDIDKRLKDILKTEEQIKQIENLIPTEAHPLLLSQRKQATELVNKLTSKVEELINEFKKESQNKPACPYRATLQEYLGKNYKIRTIHELPMPMVQTFSLPEVTTRTVQIFQKIEEKGFIAIKMLSNESLSEDGIVNTNLGHAFCTVTETPSGNSFTIDKDKTAEYLSFVETIRNTPQDFILENPRMFAYKVLHNWCELFKDIETEVEKLSAAQPLHLKQQKENPAKLLIEYADTFNSIFEYKLIEEEQIKKHQKNEKQLMPDQQKFLH